MKDNMFGECIMDIDNKLPEQKARVKIDRKLNLAGWDVVKRDELLPNSTVAVEEALMVGNKESDYLFFAEGKAIAVLEAKREENPLGDEVAEQAENYAANPQPWYGTWYDNLVPLVYMSNGNKIYFKNLLDDKEEYEELEKMHTPKQMLKIINKESKYGALPRIERKGLRDCQYEAEVKLEQSIKMHERKNLAILATGSGKTYLACLAAYRMLNYTDVSRVLFLADRNNLAKQAESEFSLFDKTEKNEPMSSLYQINRLKKDKDVKSEIVISTIQKLYSVLTGQEIEDDGDETEDQNQMINDIFDEDYTEEEPVELGDSLSIPPDHFQLIIVDECHRSIYGKWKSVLDYFDKAIVLGLTATPTPEAEAFFNKNIIEKYSYEQSVVDGVNVPSRIYRIETEITSGGGVTPTDKPIKITPKSGDASEEVIISNPIGFDASQLDRTVIVEDQIITVLETYRDAIYSELYPEREEVWEYIPKTLIFAKNDKHATEIVRLVQKVFSEKFDNGEVPENFVKKITYSAEKPNDLIREFRTEKSFRIAVTVTLVATGTDIKPIEAVLFMKDVHSDTLYTQMKGRGCRTLSDDKLKEITPNADTKECYYIVDAVGVTEHDKDISRPGSKKVNQRLSLKQLLERLSCNELSDDNLGQLRDYCSSINYRYENNPLFGHHLDLFIENYGFAPRAIANNIQKAFDEGRLPDYISPSDDNSERLKTIADLINNTQARKKLLELQKGYTASFDGDDELIRSGFSKEEAKEYIDRFEQFLEDNKDEIEALRIIYNSQDTLITHSMLVELRDILQTEHFGIYQTWRNYKTVDGDGNVDELDTKTNVNALTNLIQLVRYAYRKNRKLSSLVKGFGSGFALYCGQNQRELTESQKSIMREIGEYIVNDGAIDIMELNEVDADLYRHAIVEFKDRLKEEIEILSKFILKVA